ncbi:antibiotic biosynthesis monooxygenase family protein [Wenyingzhuangia sp. IMCC45574]
MLSIIYKFSVIEDKADAFEDAWEKLTLLFYQYGGSLGSRLHKAEENIYIAYAQWPDEETFNSAGAKLPEEATEIRTKMRASCNAVEVLHKLELVKDLIKENPQTKNV